MTNHSDRPRTPRTYPPLVNAAWHVLAPFVNPADCASKFTFTGDGGTARSLILPMNTNCALEAFFNGDVIDGKRAGLHWLTKGRVQAHLNGAETYYYRSRPNGRARVGYGGYIGAIERIGFDHQELLVTSPVRRYEHVGVLLLCADIDAHHGEADADEACDWLIEEYFPGSYWEPSTSGTGIHLYLKVSYQPWQHGKIHNTIRRMCQIVADFAKRLDAQRVARGFDAPVDGLLGLPSLIDFQGERLRVHRSRCVKLPRFPGGMPDIKRFHFAPFYLGNSFEAGAGLGPRCNPLVVPDRADPGSAWEDLVDDLLKCDFETGAMTRAAVASTGGSGDVVLNSV